VNSNAEASEQNDQECGLLQHNTAATVG